MMLSFVHEMEPLPSYQLKIKGVLNKELPSSKGAKQYEHPENASL